MRVARNDAIGERWDLKLAQRFARDFRCRAQSGLASCALQNSFSLTGVIMRSARPFILSLAAIAAIGFTASTALAKDACIAFAGTTYYVFKKVQPLKKPGQVSALKGYFMNPSFGVTYPVYGTAVVRSDGNVAVGGHAHATTAGGQSSSFGAVTDASFAGTFYYDSNGDQIHDNGSVTYSSVDCSTVPSP